MASGKLSVILWLAPAEPARTFFRETIERLAKKFGAPPFEPHLTLGLGSVEQLEQIQSSALELPVVGVDCSEQFTKTLFLRCQLTPPLAELRSSLGMEAVDFDPHLSVLYHRLPLSEKKELATTIAIDFRSVVFDEVAAIRCSAEMKAARDVETWEKLATKALS